jgi:hypothetical protein
MFDEYSTVKAGCVIPALQAVFTGALFALLVFGWGLALETEKAWLLALLLGSLAALLTWLWALRAWLATVYPSQSEPGEVTEPAAVRVEVIEQAGAVGSFLELPIEQARMVEVAQMLEAGAAFSLSALGGAGKALTRSEFESLRELFIARGLARWVNGRARNQGVELSGSGRALVRRFASMAGKPPHFERVNPVLLTRLSAHIHARKPSILGGLSFCRRQGGDGLSIQ